MVVGLLAGIVLLAVLTVRLAGTPVFGGVAAGVFAGALNGGRVSPGVRPTFAAGEARGPAWAGVAVSRAAVACAAQGPP